MGLDRKFPIPGEPKFLMPASLVAAPKDAKEGDACRSLLFRCRKEVTDRLIKHIYNDDGTQNKWWFQYAKLNFMGVRMTSDGEVR